MESNSTETSSLESNARKRKRFTISDKIAILSQVDAHSGPRGRLARRLGITRSTLNSIVSRREEIEKTYAKFGSFAKKRKSMKSSPLEKLESVLAHWLSECSMSGNGTVTSTQLKEKALYIAEYLGIGNFKASNGWIEGFKKRNNFVYKAMSSENEHAELETAESWKSEHHLPQVQGYEMCDIYSANETGLYYNLQPSQALVVPDDSGQGGSKPHPRVTVLLACNADGSDKLPPLVIGRYNRPRCLKDMKKLPIKYSSNSCSWMTEKIFEKFLTKLDKQMADKNRKILLFIDQCAAHPKNTAFLTNIKIVFFPTNYAGQLQPLDLGIIHSFKYNYRKIMIRKTLATMAEGQIDDATELKLNLFSAMQFIAEAWRLVTPAAIKKCFLKSTFLVDYINSEDFGCRTATGDLSISEDNDESNDEWRWLQPPGVMFEDYVNCDNGLQLCEVRTGEQILDEQLDLTEDEEKYEDDDEKDEIAAPEDDIKLSEALQGLETIRKYMRKFKADDGAIVLCNKIEEEIYRLRAGETKDAP